MLKVEHGKIVFSSDREAHAHAGVIGLAPDLKPTGGYDDTIYWPPDPDLKAAGGLTADDMRELADYMVGRWMRFRATLDASVVEKVARGFCEVDGLDPETEWRAQEERALTAIAEARREYDVIGDRWISRVFLGPSKFMAFSEPAR